MYPGVAVTAAQDDRVEAFGGGVAAKERIFKASRTIIVAENQAEIVLGPGGCTGGVAVHAPVQR